MSGSALHDGYLPSIAVALSDIRMDLPENARILAYQMDDAIAQLDYHSPGRAAAGVASLAGLAEARRHA